MSEPPVSLRILLAEDSQANQEVLTAILQRAGHQVDIAVNGLKAVEAVSRTPYDLVLMDLAMPEMDGIEATCRIRNLSGQHRVIPIIALTANAFLSEQQRCLQAGMNDFLAKPVNRATLLATVAHWSGCPLPIKRYEGDIAKLAQKTDQELLDIVTLERLIEDATLELSLHMIGVFIKEAMNRCQKIVEIVDVIETTLIEQLEHEAHALKSSASTFGAKRLYYASREVEMACKQKRVKYASQLAMAIPSLVHESIRALTEYLMKTHNISLHLENLDHDRCKSF
jgi:CheY-like chemotaxis protein